MGSTTMIRYEEFRRALDRLERQYRNCLGEPKKLARYGPSRNFVTNPITMPPSTILYHSDSSAIAPV